MDTLVGCDRGAIFCKFQGLRTKKPSEAKSKLKVANVVVLRDLEIEGYPRGLRLFCGGRASRRREAERSQK